MYTWILVFTVFLKNRNISSKIKRSKVTDYAALIPENEIQHENSSLISIDPASQKIYLKQMSDIA